MEGKKMYSKKQLLDFAFQEALNSCRTTGMSDELLMEVLTTAMNGYSVREGVPFTAEEVEATIVAGLETMRKDNSELYTANYDKEELLEIAFQEALNTCRLGGTSKELIVDVLTTAMNGYAVRENIPFTEEEIEAKIASGLEALKNHEFSYNLFSDKTVL